MTHIIRGSKGCFPEYVKVATPSGRVAISNLKVGDELYCFDEFHLPVIGKVVETFKHTWKETNSELIRIHLANETYIDITKNHWVLTSIGTYIEAGHLHVSDYIVSDEVEFIRITDIEELPPIDYTYNLTVEPYHTFIVNNLRVHNKGGGKSQRKPVEEPDNLKSLAYAKVIDLMCEGEIEGFATDDVLQSIYLDDVPIRNTDGSDNFEPNYSVDYRLGEIDQTPLLGFSGVAAPTSVSKELKRPYEITKRISGNVEADAVQVVLKFPVIVKNNRDNGDVKGTTISAGIKVYDKDRTLIHNKVATVKGKTTSGGYQRSYTFSLPYGTGPWDVVLERLTENDAERNKSGTWRYQTSVVWDYYNVIYYEKLSYPRSAYVGLSIDAEQFSSIPRRGYHLKLLKIKVPTNYIPAQRDPITNTWTPATYSGLWDGNFKVSWSSNPAWCYYDMLTNDRYGLGTYIDELTIDKWSIYEIGKYCDEMVPTGFKGNFSETLLEPRFTCNLYLQDRDEAFTVLNIMTSIFRGMSYWGNDRLISIQDSPRDPIALFTNANVKEGLFNYQGADLKSRHSVALVSWNDPEDFFTKKIEYVEDEELILKFGIRETNIDAIGCTSRSQAHRIGRWLLYTEKYESSLVSFTVGLSSGVFYPGAVINVLDKDRAGKRYGGRIISSTGNSMVLDKEVEFASGQQYTLTYETEDPYVYTAPTGEEKEHTFPSLQSVVIANTGITTDNISYTQSDMPLANKYGIWSISEQALQPQQFVIVSISESNSGDYDITARSNHSGKYDLIERDIELTPIPISQLSLIPKNPTIISMTEELYIDAANVKVRGFVEWNSSNSGDRYTVFYRHNEGMWEPLVSNYSGNAAQMEDIHPGEYEFRITTTNAYGRSSAAYEYPQIFTILGKTAPPADVSNFKVSSNAENIILNWNPVPDLDLAGYEIQRFDGDHHTTWITDGFSPEILANPPRDYIPLVTKYVGNSFTTDILDEDFEFATERKFTYSIKAIDTSGNYSINPSSVELVLTLPESVLGFVAVQMRDSLRFSWLPVDHRRLVGYEIRQGSSWEKAASIATVSDTKYTMSFAALTSKKFWIKAIASPGIYSKVPSSSTVDIVKPIDLNLLADFDQKSLAWPGRKIGGYISEGDFSTHLGTPIAEYYSDINLPKQYRNVITIDHDLNTFLEGSDLAATWETFIAKGLNDQTNTYGPIDSEGNPTSDPAEYVHLTWGDEEAERAWSLAIQEGQGVILDHEISLKTSQFIENQLGSIAYDVDVNSRQPDYSTVVAPDFAFSAPVFGPDLGRYSEGLNISGRLDPLEYSVSMPSEFSLIFWASSDITESYSFIRLYNSATQDHIQLKYSHLRNYLFLDDGSTELVGLDVVPAREAVDTKLWCVGITQSSTQLILQLGSLSGAVILSSAKELTKVAPTYDKLKVI